MRTAASARDATVVCIAGIRLHGAPPNHRHRSPPQRLD
jgi:hypothetical protein